MRSHVLPILLGLFLLFAGTAEAMTGHCAKQGVSVQPAAEMSAHCAEMMGEMPSSNDIQIPATPDDQPSTPSDTGPCCCAIAATPALMTGVSLDAPLVYAMGWGRILSIDGQSAASHLTKPPPRV